MKTIFTLLLAAGICGLSTSATFAQSSDTNTYHTNIVLNASISLTAYVQHYVPVPPPSYEYGLVQVQHISSKDIVAAIAADAGGGTNDLSGAKLIYITTGFGTTNVDTEFALRKNGHDTIVSNFFNIATLDDTNYPINDVYTQSNVKPARSNGYPGPLPPASENSTDYTITAFHLNTSRFRAAFQGLTHLRASSIVYQKHVIYAPAYVTSETTAVAGSGTVNGGSGMVNAILKGTVTIAGRKVEVVQDP